ncbi:unnamed protein product [Mycena citricolor]|uniref:RRM domain-containing protein n=2 Tax=Mycena citricolor TaxID=2018698 RepID=A0AAD2HEP4_9AGAR|nr:unnamed protein product [Mycena citricolor]
MMGKRIPSKQNFVLVGSLDPRITAAQLQSHFASCGSISAVRMSYAGSTGVSATVEFEQPAGAKKALRLSRSTVADFDDRPIKVVMNVLHMEEIHHRPSATAVAHALTSDTLYLAQHVPQKAEIIVKPPFVPVPGERHEHLTGAGVCFLSDVARATVAYRPAQRADCRCPASESTVHNGIVLRTQE